MAESKADREPTLVECWLQEQQEWQRTLLAYIDSMAKDDNFLVHLGNAMRGSLLAGKPYPAAGVSPPPAAPPDERLDRVLFALNTLQGQLQDLFMSIEEIRRAVAVPAASTATAAPQATTSKARPRRKNVRRSAGKRKARA